MRALLAAAAVAAILCAARTARAKGCVEVSDVVGEQSCTRYANDWSNEGRLPAVFRFGFRYGEVSTAGLTLGSRPSKKQPNDYRYDYSGEELGVSRLTGGGLDGGVTFFVWGQLYLGADAGIAWGSAGAATIRRNVVGPGGVVSPLVLEDAGGTNLLFVHAGVPLGYRVPLGHFSLRPEVLFGGVHTSISHRATGSQGASSSASGWSALVEPRVAVDVWLTQHVSVSAYGGVNALDPTARAFGIALSWHPRAFDGAFALW